MARQDRTAREVQATVGVSASAWQLYFKTCSRDIPFGLIVRLCETFGVEVSELIRRAEQRL